MGWDETWAQLQQECNANRLTPFNQVQAAEQNTLGRLGYCRGASIDWLRKRLVRKTQLKTLNDKRDNRQRVKRMYDAFEEQRLIPAVSAETAILEAGDSHWDSKASALEKQYSDAIGDGVATQELANQIVNIRKQGYEDLQTSLDRNQQQVLEGNDVTNPHWQKAALLSKKQKEGDLEPFWKDIAKSLDDRFKRKNGNEPKGFSSLDIIGHSPPNAPCQTTKSRVEDALNNELFGIEKGMMICFNTDKPDGSIGDGHAVAVYGAAEILWELFDPNYGVIFFNTRNNLSAGLVKLLEEEYGGGSDRKPGGHYYVFRAAE